MCGASVMAESITRSIATLEKRRAAPFSYLPQGEIERRKIILKNEDLVRLLRSHVGYGKQSEYDG